MDSILQIVSKIQKQLQAHNQILESARTLLTGAMLCVLFERWYLSYAIFWSINHTMNGEMKNKLLDINSTIAFFIIDIKSFE